MGPGPGYYTPEKGNDSIRKRSPQWCFSNNAPRPQTIVDPSLGPGTFEEHRNFGENLGNISIGQRRV